MTLTLVGVGFLTDFVGVTVNVTYGSFGGAVFTTLLLSNVLFSKTFLSSISAEFKPITVYLFSDFP